MKCKYCHKSAGLFSSKHKECELKYLESLSEIKSRLVNKFENIEIFNYGNVKQEFSLLMQTGYVSDTDFDDIVLEVMEMLFSGRCKMDAFLFPLFLVSVPLELKHAIVSLGVYKKYWCDFFEDYIRKLGVGEKINDEYSALLTIIKQDEMVAECLNAMLVSILDEKIYKCLEDSIINDEEEDEISCFVEMSTLSHTRALYSSVAYQKLAQSLVLRDVQEGKCVKRIKIYDLHLLLGKQENVLWVFKDVKGYIEKTGHRYIGGRNGVSMKVCKGIYYHWGASRGQSVLYQYQDFLGGGDFIVTNKNLYFLGVKQVKLSISKILSYEPYSDGIVLVKDGTNPRPYTFIGFDPWFVVNVMHLLVE